MTEPEFTDGTTETTDNAETAAEETTDSGETGADVEDAGDN